MAYSAKFLTNFDVISSRQFYPKYQIFTIHSISLHINIAVLEETFIIWPIYLYCLFNLKKGNVTTWPKSGCVVDRGNFWQGGCCVDNEGT